MRLRKEWGNVKLPGSSTGGNRTAGSSLAARSAAGNSAAGINGQIRSLVPGQTLRGQIIARNGSEVQIRVSDNVVIQAKVDQNMNLELGKNMTFEVRNNGSTLTLSPLFTNISADVNVMKAIDMAGLPLNEITVDMTSQMMKAGLSVDKNTLLQVYHEVSSFPEAAISDVINLHRLGLSVTEENINQMISYRNLNHQLLEGMSTVLGALPEAMEGMLGEENLQGLTSLYQELFEILQERAENPPQMNLGGEEAVNAGQIQEQSLATWAEESNLQALAEAEHAVSLTENASIGSTPLAAAEMLLEEQGTASRTEQGTTGVESQGAETFASASRTLLSEQLLDMVSRLPLSQEEANGLSEKLRQFAQGNLSSQRFFAIAGRMLEAAQTAENGVRNLHRIFSGEEFRAFLNSQLKNLWTVSPEEVAAPGKMEELYRRLDRQLKGLGQALENGGQAESAAFRAVSNLSQNIDFMNQLNQMYNYVQFPLRFLEGEAHGELYVYTNKRCLAAREGKISALLHLDMEHLGPVDVYVTLEQSKVNTRFYVQDDEILDFLAEHMEVLTKRLADRGYDCSFSMTTRGEEAEEENSGIGPLLSQEKEVALSQYAFDVRT